MPPSHSEGSGVPETIILFDLDGTMIDAKIPILESIDHAFRSEGLGSPDPDVSASFIGLPLRDIFRELGAPEAKMDSLVDHYRSLFIEEGPRKTRLMPGGREALHMAAGFAIPGVVTTRVSTYSRLLLENLLGEDVNLFRTIVGFESVTFPKPHSEPVELAIRRISEQRGGGQFRTWMIGDTPLDIQSAKSAGVGAIGVRNGHGDLSAYEGDEGVFLADHVLDGVRFIRERVPL